MRLRFMFALSVAAAALGAVVIASQQAPTSQPQQGEVRLVYQALHERQRLRKNAPHLVHLLPFMIPILTRGGVVSRKIGRGLGMAMWGYDLTGGWRIGKLHKKLKGDAAPTTPACA